MALPPERINIKRRRHDEPVETLFLEHDSGHNKKRRFTDFCFKRLQIDQASPSISSTNPPDLERRSVSINAHNAIPTVRTTTPGDEVRETLALKAAHKERLQCTGVKIASTDIKETDSSSHITIAKSANVVRNKQLSSPTVRRFHLSRERSAVLAPNIHGGIRKHRPSSKSHMAVFVERPTNRSPNSSSRSIKNFPMDRLVEIQESQDRPQSNMVHSEGNLAVVARSSFDHPFSQADPMSSKTGHSIRDPPNTWNHDSDQLADELAALALEIESGGADGSTDKSDLSTTDNTPSVLLNRSEEDDFVYETYLRLPHDPDQSESLKPTGVLIIEEEDEELWRTFVEDEDESEWDEEDADSNAENNPANEYPDEELESDDELGYDAYGRYRKYGSDYEDDQFD